MSALRLDRPVRGFMAVIAALAAAALLALSSAAPAQAYTEHDFCWGYNLPGGQICQSAYWNMHAAYANSSDQPVCIVFWELTGACMSHPNEGVYIEVPGTTYNKAVIHNPTGATAKVYGVFWTSP